MRRHEPRECPGAAPFRALALIEVHDNIPARRDRRGCEVDDVDLGRSCVFPSFPWVCVFSSCKLAAGQVNDPRSLEISVCAVVSRCFPFVHLIELPSLPVSDCLKTVSAGQLRIISPFMKSTFKISVVDLSRSVEQQFPKPLFAVST